MSAWTCRHTDGKVVQKIVPPRPRIPWWKGPGADSEEKQEPASDIDTALVDSLKVLDPKGPIREADIVGLLPHVRFVPCVDGSGLARAFFTFCSVGRCSHVFGLLVRFT
jgi:hypothetical protein